LWASFVGFFSPDEELQGEGPLYKELADLDAQIQREKLACARERRPQKKSFLKSHLEELAEQRKGLVEKIKAQEEDGVASSSSIAEVTSLTPDSPIVAVAKQPEIALIFRDTIYVYDTVYVERCLNDSLVSPQKFLPPEP
jgi:hypothetical protein